MKAALVAVLIVVILPVAALGLETDSELGLRGGSNAKCLNESFTVAEIYFLKNLPWHKELSPSTRVYTRLDAGAGFIGSNDDEGGWLALGGDVVLSLAEGLWEVEVGFRPTFMTEHRYDDVDFGGPLHFSSHAGVNLNVGKVALGYRYMHTSNAGIYGDNPGLDLNLVGMGVRF